MSAPIKLAMTPREWGMLVVLSILWGGSFFFVGMAVIGVGLVAIDRRLAGLLRRGRKRV